MSVVFFSNFTTKCNVDSLFSECIPLVFDKQSTVSVQLLWQPTIVWCKTAESCSCVIQYIPTHPMLAVATLKYEFCYLIVRPRINSHNKYFTKSGLLAFWDFKYQVTISSNSFTAFSSFTSMTWLLGSWYGVLTG